MIRTATDWVDKMIKKQRSDGYLGTYYEENADIYDDYNAWGTGCALRGLIAFYEATGRADVLEAVHKCLKWFVREWSGDKKTCYAGPFIIEPMIFAYHITKDEELLRFSEE
jgi:rhamnogalacturonyl hydrolase YesR